MYQLWDREWQEGTIIKPAEAKKIIFDATPLYDVFGVYGESIKLVLYKVKSEEDQGVIEAIYDAEKDVWNTVPAIFQTDVHARFSLSAYQSKEEYE